MHYLLITIFILFFIIGYYCNGINNYANNYENLQISCQGGGQTDDGNFDVAGDDWIAPVTSALNDLVQAGVEVMETKNGKRVFSFRKFFKYLKDQPSDLTKKILIFIVKKVIKHYFPEIGDVVEIADQIEDCVEDAIHLFRFIVKCEEAFTCIEAGPMEEDMAKWVEAQGIIAAEEEVDVAVAATGVGVGVAAGGEVVIAAEEVGETAVLVGSIIFSVIECFGGPVAFGDQMVEMVKAISDMDNCAALCKKLIEGKITERVEAGEQEVLDMYHSLVVSIRNNSERLFDTIHSYLIYVFDKVSERDGNKIEYIKRALKPVYQYMFNEAPDYRNHVLRNPRTSADPGSIIGPLDDMGAQARLHIICIKMIIHIFRHDPILLEYAVLITKDYVDELGHEFVEKFKSDVGEAWNQFTTEVDNTVDHVETTVDHTVDKVSTTVDHVEDDVINEVVDHPVEAAAIAFVPGAAPAAAVAHWLVPDIFDG